MLVSPTWESSELTPEKRGACLFSSGILVSVEADSTCSMPVAAGGKAKGNGGPTLGHSLLPDLTHPPALLSLGSGQPQNPMWESAHRAIYLGDPSAASPYSLWVLRGSFAAVSHEGKCVEPSGVDPFWPPRPGRWYSPVTVLP